METLLPNTIVNTTDKDLDSHLLNLAYKSMSTFNYQYLAAASELADGTILAWFNNKFLHTAPLALNLVHNAMIRTHSIHVVNAPFFSVRPNSTRSSTQMYDNDISGFGIVFGFCVGCVMPMISSIIVMFYEQVN